VDDIFAWIDEHLDDSLKQLATLCAQPSIAAQNEGMQECAALVSSFLQDIGAQVELVPTDGFPVVYGELAGASQRTLSFYNHYDVQPPEPLDEWSSPPFSPQIRDGKFFARGASDDKGDLVARLTAVRAWKAVRGELPLTVKFIVDGEEEIGSPHLHQFAQEHPDLLAADGNVWESGKREDDGRPAIFLGLKGICYIELSVRSASTDIHSSWGGVVPNAAWRLVWALESLKGPDERVSIPGFYDRVREPTAAELAALAELPCNEDAWHRQFGLERLVEDAPPIKLMRRHLFEPLCNICGMTAGYTGRGMKTVIPSTASAKVDLRLVPDQKPDEVFALVCAHLKDSGFDDVEAKLLGTAMPAKTPLDDPLAQVAAQSAQRVYGLKPTIYPSMAGSGPMYLMCQAQGIPSVMVGVGYSGSGAHAPNENIRVEDFALGAKHIAAILEAFAQR